MKNQKARNGPLKYKGPAAGVARVGTDSVISRGYRAVHLGRKQSPICRPRRTCLGPPLVLATLPAHHRLRPPPTPGHRFGWTFPSLSTSLVNPATLSAHHRLLPPPTPGHRFGWTFPSLSTSLVIPATHPAHHHLPVTVLIGFIIAYLPALLTPLLSRPRLPVTVLAKLFLAYLPALLFLLLIRPTTTSRSPI
ncbi:hypothetical protein J6590_044223 [Homalodisca vitripennis]|nr:hypothetical protein J6590_044223 [Homalodisca vitripennis]